MLGKIIALIIIALLIVLIAIWELRHLKQCLTNSSTSPKVPWWKGWRIAWWFIPIVVVALAVLIIFNPELKTWVTEKRAAANVKAALEELTPEAAKATTTAGLETVSGNALVDTAAKTEDALQEQETAEAEPEVELPPEPDEDASLDEQATALMEWRKTADEASRAYLPRRRPGMTDEEYKAELMVYLESEELDEAFIPRDLTDEEAILYVKEILGEDFDINRVELSRNSMPSQTTRRQNTVRNQVQAYYNDPKLEGWSDPVLPADVLELFWKVYGVKNKHSDEWNALVAGETVPAEIWKEKYELEIEEEELDFEGFLEYAYWIPILREHVSNPVYADETAQFHLLTEKEFPGWLDNAPSSKDFKELYDAAMETEGGVTNLCYQVKLDNGQVMTYVRPEVVIQEINIYLTYRRFEVNAKNPIQAKTSTINFHLPPADGNYVRTEALTDPDDQESEPAFNLLLRYKNRKVAVEAGVDIFDCRHIIYIAKKPAVKPKEEQPKQEKKKKEQQKQPEQPVQPVQPDNPGGGDTPPGTPPPGDDEPHDPDPDPENPPGKNPSGSTLDNGTDGTHDGDVDTGDGGVSNPGDTTEPVGGSGDQGGGDGNGTVDVGQDTPATDVGDSPDVKADVPTDNGEAPKDTPPAPSEDTKTNVSDDAKNDDSSFTISDDD